MPCGGGSEILTEPEYIPDIFKIRMEDKHMKRTVKRILLVAMAALLCLGVFAGCAGTKDIKIGAMPADSNISFFQELANRCHNYRIFFLRIKLWWEIETEFPCIF